MKTFVCSLGCILLFFSSCSIQQEISLNTNGGGTYRGNIVVSEDFSSYLSELASLSMDQSEEFKLFDKEKIKTDLEEEENGVTVTGMTVEDTNTMRLELDFQSIEGLLQTEEARAAGIITFEKKTDNSKTVHIHLDRDNYKQLNSLFSDEQSIIMDTFGPEENEGLTEEEYLEMMSFALGESGSKLISTSVIETEITVDGTILEQNGGVLEGDTVIYRIPLIRILLLDQTIDYSLTFR